MLTSFAVNQFLVHFGYLLVKCTVKITEHTVNKLVSKTAIKLLSNAAELNIMQLCIHSKVILYTPVPCRETETKH